MDLDSLKNARSNAKGVFTRTKNWLDINLEEVNDIFKFEALEEVLRNAYLRYSGAQDALDCMLKPEQNTENREIIDDLYFTLLATIRRKIVELTPVAPVLAQSTPQISNVAPLDVKLPEISIPQFSGKITEWTSFYDLFQALINSNKNLSDIQKFVYLKSYLKGEPLKLISNLTVTSGNYKVALDTLEKRYTNKNALIKNLLSDLIELKPIQGNSNIQVQLREFHVSVKNTLQALTNLKLSDKVLLDTVLIYLLESKLDFGSRRSLEFENEPGKTLTLDDFLKKVDARCNHLESLNSKEKNKVTAPSKTSKAVFHSNVNDSPKSNAPSGYNAQKRCFFCGEKTHNIYNCMKFKNSSYTEKQNFVKNKKLCFNCLGSAHLVQQCGSKLTCGVCRGQHHTLLHGASFSSRNINQQQNGNSLSRNSQVGGRPLERFDQHRNNYATQSSNLGHSSESQSSERVVDQVDDQDDIRMPGNSRVSVVCIKDAQILLGTALVYIYSSHGEAIEVKALLDPGSQTSFISQELMLKLNYAPYERKLNISGIAENSSICHEMLDVVIHSWDSQESFKMSCAILEKITCQLPQLPIDCTQMNIMPQFKLADIRYHTPSKIDLLIGADYYYSLILGGVQRLGKNMPVLQNTRLGWVIAGRVPASCLKQDNCLYSSDELVSTHSVSSFSHVSLHVNASLESSLEKTIEKFWKMEDIPEFQESSFSNLTPEEKKAEKIFLETTKILSDGSYQVDMPLKSPNAHLNLGNSLAMATKRFFNLEKKFRKDELFFNSYKEVMNEYLELKHAKLVPLCPLTENNENKYFLPHFAVVREESISTKVRVVFDASVRTSTGFSLNDVMLKGFQVQPNLFDILLRFRSFTYVLTADIEKMYRQIKVNPKETFLLNVLWRDKTSSPLQCIELNRVTFGTNCAPYLATRVLVDLADRNEEEFPLASRMLRHQTFVDDILGGCNQISELPILYDQLNTVLNSAGFNLHKCGSNSPHFLETLSVQGGSVVNFGSHDSPNKVLGLRWNSTVDCLQISLPRISLEGIPTKRKILSILAQCFDPLGFLAPIIIKGKCLIQKLWSLKLDWDTEISEELILKEWKSFTENLYSLSHLRIPRCLFDNKPKESVELHVFSDASSTAFAACGYIRTIYNDGTISSHLLVSKSRVAPLKVVSIPRLELSAMLLAANLVKALLTILQPVMEVHEVHLWSDSEVALYWINSHSSRWSVFVANRVAKIQELTSNCCWHHVRSKQNPADLPSRGMKPQGLLNSDLWWYGPDFLMDRNIDYSQFRINLTIDSLPEEKKVSLIVAPVAENFWQQLFDRVSIFSRLQRIVAYILRFAHNVANDSRTERLKGSLSPLELEKSTKLIAKKLQQQGFSREMHELRQNIPLSNKHLRSLNPILSEDGLIRVGGRLENAEVPYNQKHPILLPARNRIVSLLLSQMHIRLGHAGAQTTLSNVRLQYWPLNGLREVKRIIHNCIICFRFRAQPMTQIMADLPSERVVISRPFQKVSIDYGGYFLLKSSHLKKAPLVKAYIAIFICMATRAIHIELVTSLSSDAFIMTLKRFIARRGNPSVIVSDNATNFWGARNQLRELHQFFLKETTQISIKEFCAKNFIEFKFIPPRAPHWGGLHEAAIKSAKYHIYRLVGKNNFTFEVFYTILTEIEAVLNSRPLTEMSNDPNDFQCLTPGHFLIGTNLTAYPEQNVTMIAKNRLSLYQTITQIRQSFWKLWSISYLNQLQNRPKWLVRSKNLEVDSLVLLKEDQTPPLCWPLARVVETYPGKDGCVRSAKVRTQHGLFVRPIRKLCPLPMETFAFSPEASNGKQQVETL